ncbi:UDP-glycosyltransferase 87A1-like [Aristolochia californica]|uniref:UDP-glycosyltransferase 87A1-like n=1 Tax=Aristolochia californica TaxID=171875 RepID=UPI0035DC0BC5
MDPVDVKKGNAGCHVIAVPYPGRGHVNPMMNLCELLASRELAITFVVTEEWLQYIASGGLKSANIRLASIPNVIPSEQNRGADFAGFVEAVSNKMEAPFVRLLDELPGPISCIIADTFIPWVVEVGIRRNIPVASLWTMAPSVFSVLRHFDLFISNRHFPLDDFPASAFHNNQDRLTKNYTGREDERVEYIPGISSIRLSDLYSIFRGANLRSSRTGPSILERAIDSASAATKAQYLLFSSCCEFDIHATDTLSSKLPLPVYIVGPCIPYMKHCTEAHRGDTDYCIWLNNQPRQSVLYVSLGSFLSTSASQIEELANGLLASNVRFLWVGRGDVQLLQEMIGGENETGLVVPWCDQLKVLSHTSVGGFLTHCGWNSTMEGVFCGVPMLTFPLFWDQFVNSKMIVEDWGVGMRLKTEVGDKVVESGEISELVQRFMAADGEESKEMRRRCGKLQKICKRAVEKDGSTQRNLKAFVMQVESCSGLANCNR